MSQEREMICSNKKNKESIVESKSDVCTTLAAEDDKESDRVSVADFKQGDHTSE